MAGTTDLLTDTLYEPCVLCASDMRFWNMEAFVVSSEGCPLCDGLGAVVHACDTED